MNNATNINIRNPIEVRQVGLDALVAALGPIGMAMFLKQYEIGEGDYTKEREKFLGNLVEEDIEQMIFRNRIRDEITD